MGDATPGGKPASSIHSKSMMRLSGVWLAGLLTMVQPAARAGAILRACRVMGKFHGLMAPTTPTGCLKVRWRLPGCELGMSWP